MVLDDAPKEHAKGHPIEAEEVEHEQADKELGGRARQTREPVDYQDFNEGKYDSVGKLHDVPAQEVGCRAVEPRVFFFEEDLPLVGKGESAGHH